MDIFSVIENEAEKTSGSEGLQETDAAWLSQFFSEAEEESLDELNELLAEYHVVLPDGLQKTEVSNVRRPLVLYRGKPITREQVMQLVTGEEPLFSLTREDEAWKLGSGVLKSIFYGRYSNSLSTWVHSDGTIGGNLICFVKYPEIYEILPDYVHLAEKYPFLDMIISYTTFEECCCYDCDAFLADKEYALCLSADCRYKECGPYLDLISKYSLCNHWHGSKTPDFEEMYFEAWDTAHVRRDACDRVELTIWIHEGKTEILFGDRAGEKFVEYDGKYCAPEYDFLFSYYIHNFIGRPTCIFDKTFVEDCFEYAGMPRERVDEYVERGILAPFNDSALVLTKDWVIEQYNKYIAKYTDG